MRPKQDTAWTCARFCPSSARHAFSRHLHRSHHPVSRRRNRRSRFPIPHRTANRRRDGRHRARRHHRGIPHARYRGTHRGDPPRRGIRRRPLRGGRRHRGQRHRRGHRTHRSRRSNSAPPARCKSARITTSPRRKDFTSISRPSPSPPTCRSCSTACPAAPSIEIAPETAARLAADCPNIVAIKEAGGSVDRVNQLVQALPADFGILCGDDPLTLPFVSCGATGLVSVASNLIPEVIVRLVSACLSGSFRRSARPAKAILPADARPDVARREPGADQNRRRPARPLPAGSPPAARPA